MEMGTSKQTSFYYEDELRQLGFASLGENVLISRNARFYGISSMRLGNHVRIDDFVILSGNIEIGNYVHVSAYAALYGGGAAS